MRPADLRLQRDRALACLVLAFCTAVAVFVSVFGLAERRPREEARRAIAAHEGLLREADAVLLKNQYALKEELAAYAEVLRARRR